MSHDWRVGLARTMARCNLRPPSIFERKDRRIMRRKTGRGPSGPSEKAKARANGR